MNVLPVQVKWIGRCLARRSEEGIAGSEIQIRSMSGDLRTETCDKRCHVMRPQRENKAVYWQMECHGINQNCALTVHSCVFVAVFVSAVA
jgi:hypothetical protein